MMHAPERLPVAGDWITTDDGASYEVRHCVPHCTAMTLADGGGVHVWSTDEEETLWLPWSEVASVSHRRTDRIVLTITHDQTRPPGPRTIAALVDALTASMTWAGISATVTAEINPDKEA